MKETLIQAILDNPEKYGRFNRSILNKLSEQDLSDIIVGNETIEEEITPKAEPKKKTAKQKAAEAKTIKEAEKEAAKAEQEVKEAAAKAEKEAKAKKAKESNKKTTPAKNIKKLSSSINKEEDYIIEFKDIFKSFSNKGGKKKVHQGVSFGIRRGETVALVGANGAGKTVLMETLVRVIHQDSGQIIFDMDGLNPFNEIGMQFQDADSTGNLTPKELIKFISIMYKDKVDQAQTEEMIRVYGITEYINRKIKKLSGGQRQRVNLLLATMHNPKLMILDEFITGLDILSVRDILEYIRGLKEKNNSTLIIISHQPEEIKNLSDRIFVLRDGTIQDELLTKDVNKKYDGDFGQFLVEEI